MISSINASGIVVVMISVLSGNSLHADALQEGFIAPPPEHRPETLFFLIGGNVSKAGLTKDLEALSGAGIKGIQLFHGQKGGRWPGVEPQIQALSPAWDGIIGHVADETKRLGLRFMKQNCAGWALSGGPWITPDKAMRHLVSGRTNINGGKTISITLERPEPGMNEDWRDYRDVAVLAFPTPTGDDGEWLKPIEVRSKRNLAGWSDILAGREKAEVVIEPGHDPESLEIIFDKPTTLRSIEFPPIARLVKRFANPKSKILVQAADDKGWRDLVRHTVPHGNWQDSDWPYVIALPDATASKYRLVFENGDQMTVSFLRFSSAARSQDWRAQAAYTLRSMDRIETPIQARESWIRSADIVDLTQKMDANGQLTWAAPPGIWTVVRFGHVNTGAKNKPAPREATGFECDKLSVAGAELHFENYIGRLTKPGGPADDGRLHVMHIDSWECRTQTWTPAMEQEFEKRRGYPLRRWLPALAGWVVDDHRTSERFLRDWRANISDLLVDNYYGRMGELARTRGLKLSFQSGPGDASPGDILHYFSKADLPSTEAWLTQNPDFEVKPLAPTVSAAHIYGKPKVAAETFTRFGVTWNEHPFHLKPTADRAFARGVTHIMFHTMTHNPLDHVPGSSFGVSIGSPILRGQTWWKHMPHFTDYLARCGFMLERGQPVAEVLWYLGDDLDHKPRQDQAFPNGYRFDYCNADVLLNRLSVRDGLLSIPEGTNWRVIWLPAEQCARLTPATLGKLKELIEAGATVLGKTPEINPTLSGGMEADRQFASIAKELWGEKPQPSGDRTIGKGRLLWGGDLASNLVKLGIAQDVVGASSGSWFHRRDGATDIYFVVAEKEPIHGNMRFRAQGIPEFWNPLTGKTSPVPVFQQDQSGTTIAMQLPEAGSVFVVFRPGAAASAFEQISVNGQPWLNAMDAERVQSGEPPAHAEGPNETENKPPGEPASPVMEALPGDGQFVAWTDGDYQFKPQGRPPVSRKVAGTRSLPLTSGWTLSFPSGWDAPSTLDIGDLKPWSELKDKATRHFSGSATYRTTVRLDAPKADERVQLDLGRVANIAEVRINGRKATVLWTSPFRTDITEHLKAGNNEFEIEVTNTWSNRLAFDASLPEAERKTWTTQGPKANSPVKTAGLEGPVQLRFGKRLDLRNWK